MRGCGKKLILLSLYLISLFVALSYVKDVCTFKFDHFDRPTFLSRLFSHVGQTVEQITSLLSSAAELQAHAFNSTHYH